MKNIINLSIIIPHFNDFETVNKILSMRYPDDVEVILVDDNTEDFYEYFSHPRNIKNFTVTQNSSVNKGAGACRNIGQKIAQGNWIIFIDSDDIFVDNYYEILSNYFKYKYDIVFFKPMSYYANSKRIADRHLNYVNIIDDYLKEPSRKNELYLRYDFISPCSKLVKRSFLLNNDIWFDETISANDTMWSVKTGFHMKNFNVSKKTFYIIHKYEGSLTTLRDKKLFDVRFNVRLNKYNYLKDKLNPEDFKKYEPYRITQGLLVKAFFRGYRFKELYRYYRIIRKNNMHFFSWRLINPIIYIKKIIKKLKFQEKGY